MLEQKKLKDLDLKVSYDTGQDRIVKDFYIPCLERTDIYQRAVGYFTSNGLSIAAQGITHLIQRGGRIQLVASPCLLEEDVDAINYGYQKREEILAGICARTLINLDDALIKEATRSFVLYDIGGDTRYTTGSSARCTRSNCKRNFP